jgi:lysophospholipase L1-like esterase
MISRNTSVRFEEERRDFNARLREDHSFADVFVDVALDPRLDAPFAFTDFDWYADGVHPTVAGYGIIADAVMPALLELARVA